MWWIPEGEKYVLGLIGFSFLAFIISRILLRPDLPPQPRSLVLTTYALWVFVLYSSFFYVTDGDSWKQLKAFIAIAIYSLIFRNFLPRKEFIKPILFISSASLTILSWGLFLAGEVRVGGFINPIPFATAVASIMLLCFTLSLNETRTSDKAILQLLAALLFSTLLLTQTRGVIIPAILLVAALYFYYSLSAKGVARTLITTALITVLAGAATLYIAGDRMKLTLEELALISGENYESSIGLRIVTWDAAVKLWKTAPVTGLGDTHREVLNKLIEQGEVHPQLNNFTPSHYHNQFLNELVMKGVIGLILFLLVIFSVVNMTMKNKNPQLRLASLSIISLYLISSLSDVPFKHPETIFVFFMAIYIINALETNNTREHHQPTP